MHIKSLCISFGHIGIQFTGLCYSSTKHRVNRMHSVKHNQHVTRSTCIWIYVDFVSDILHVYLVVLVAHTHIHVYLKLTLIFHSIVCNVVQCYAYHRLTFVVSCQYIDLLRIKHCIYATTQYNLVHVSCYYFSHYEISDL